MRNRSFARSEKNPVVDVSEVRQAKPVDDSMLVKW